ncbi:MAG: serine protease [Verrucomicrobiota bacterium]
MFLQGAGAKLGAISLIWLTCSFSLFAEGAETCESDTAPSPQTSSWTENIARDLAPRFVTIQRFDLDGRIEATGSGVLLSDQLVATCFHTIDRARAFTLTLSTGIDLSPESVVAFDEEADLALIRVSSVPHDLAGVEIETSRINVGQRLAAMGNPNGDPGYFVEGIAAAIAAPELPGDLIPLAIPVEPGSSGGPVVNTEGKLLGIISLKDLSRPGIGYAISSAMIPQLIQSAQPIPYPEWIEHSVLDLARWEPDLAEDWFRRKGRIHLSEKLRPGRGVRLCRSVETLSKPTDGTEERPIQLFTDVQSHPEGSAGIAFGEIDNDEIWLWSVEQGEKLALARVGNIGEFPKVVERFEIPESFRSDWIQMKVIVSSEQISCYIGDVLAHRIDRNDDSVSPIWAGLQGSLGHRAEFRNFASRAASVSTGAASPGTHLQSRQALFDLAQEVANLRQEAQASRIAEIQGELLERLNGEAASLPPRSLLDFGFLITSLDDCYFEFAAVTRQSHSWQKEVSSSFSRKEQAPAASESEKQTNHHRKLAESIREIFIEKLRIEFDETDGQGSRLAHDPRRLFEDRAASSFTLQALMVDTLRGNGFENASATHSPHFVIFDADCGTDEAFFLNVSNGFVQTLRDFTTSPCQHSLPPEHAAAVAAALTPQSDQAFLVQWLSAYKDTIPEDTWPEKLTPFLETLVEIDPANYAAWTELTLVEMSSESPQGGSGSSLRPSLSELLTVHAAEIDPDRVMKILEFRGLNVRRLLNNFGTTTNQSVGFKK